MLETVNRPTIRDRIPHNLWPYFTGSSVTALVDAAANGIHPVIAYSLLLALRKINVSEHSRCRPDHTIARRANLDQLQNPDSNISHFIHALRSVDETELDDLQQQISGLTAIDLLVILAGTVNSIRTKESMRDFLTTFNGYAESAMAPDNGHENVKKQANIISRYFETADLVSLHRLEARTGIQRGASRFRL